MRVKDMPQDRIEFLGKTKIQHGKLNNRIYVMDLDPSECPGILDELDALALKNRYSKIFAKVPQTAKRFYDTNGYVTEAKIPAFFTPTIDGYFMGKYLTDERRIAQDPGSIQDIRQAAKKRARTPKSIPFLPAGHELRACVEEDAMAMAALYSQVFESYPFPIFDPAYLIETMHDNILYFGVWSGTDLVAVSSCEMNKTHKNVEMTDFSTHPEQRGKGLAKVLLQEMDATMRADGFRVAFTIARAISMPMNLTFADNGYAFSGTLVNNTHIGAEIESMNVWWKLL